MYYLKTIQEKLNGIDKRMTTLENTNAHSSKPKQRNPQIIRNTLDDFFTKFTHSPSKNSPNFINSIKDKHDTMNDISSRLLEIQRKNINK